MIRLLSGVALAAAAIAAILFLPLAALRVLACLVAVLAAREYLGIVLEGTTMSSAAPVLILVALTAWWVGTPAIQGLFALVLIALAGVAVEVLFLGLTLETAAVRFVAPWYLGMPLGMLVAVQGGAGRWATLLLVATVVVSDSAQYYSGRWLGRHRLAPVISPKKTVEGAIGGVVCGTVFMAVAGSRVFALVPIISLVLLGAAIVVLGICGDLFESSLKRGAGVKDSSTLIPGHGGVLDRIDALLFATPAFYLYLRMYGGG